MARMLRMAIVLPAFLVFGCRHGGQAVMRTWATPDPPYVATPGSANAFDGYVMAASEAEQDAPVLLDRISFTPQMRRDAVTQTHRAMVTLRQASNRACDFQFRAYKPYEPVPYRKGWRLLGRVLAWSIQDAVKNGNYAAAISDTILATKFGFDLTGGGPMDASLGLSIVDDARRALAPSLIKIQSSDLANLGAGLERALAAKPALSKVFQNDHKNMLLGVQYVQDAFIADRYDGLDTNLGSDCADAVAYLKNLKAQGGAKQQEYFDKFAGEADEEVAGMTQAASTAACARPKDPTPHSQKEERPWKRFGRHFFTAGAPLLGIDDMTVARTRLFALNADLLRLAKVSKAVPKTLDGFPKLLTIDPYSGQPFIYHAEGMDFSIYSVGENCQDDGGETDETFTSPDLKIERPGG